MKPVVRSAAELTTRFATRLVCMIAVATLAFAASARAEVTPWDQAKVTELAQKLETAANDLNETLRRQPTPSVGSMQSRAFFRLRHSVRSAASRVAIARARAPERRRSRRDAAGLHEHDADGGRRAGRSAAGLQLPGAGAARRRRARDPEPALALLRRDVPAARTRHALSAVVDRREIRAIDP